MILRALILCFWIVMMTLLIVRDLWPRQEMTSIPLENALQRLFDGGRESRLHIFHKEVRVGELEIKTFNQGKIPVVVLEGGVSLLWDSGYHRWLFGARAMLQQRSSLALREGAIWARMASRTKLYGSYAFNHEQDYHHVIIGAPGFGPYTVEGASGEVRDRLILLLNKWTQGALGSLVSPVLEAGARAGQAHHTKIRAFSRRPLVGIQTEAVTEIQIVANEDVLCRLWLGSAGELRRVELKGDYVLISDYDLSGLQ